MKKVLTIAGSDCSGGAGIQADIKTITAHKMYAMSAVTALTAQNTTGVYGIFETSPEFVAQQLDCIFKDIRPDSVKIGMVSSDKIISVIADKLTEYNAENIVADPVMVSTSGSRLLCKGAEKALISQLLPKANVITPNIPEAEILSGIKITGRNDMLRAAEILYEKTHCCIMLKGGHSVCDANDLLFDGSSFKWLNGSRVNTLNTHGTGCTLSSAVACGLAMGLSFEKAAENAKNYVTGALKSGLNLGSGNGPLNHTFNLIN